MGNFKEPAFYQALLFFIPLSTLYETCYFQSGVFVFKTVTRNQ